MLEVNVYGSKEDEGLINVDILHNLVFDFVVTVLICS